MDVGCMGIVCAAIFMVKLDKNNLCVSVSLWLQFDVIPPLHIQKEIVARIEEEQKLVDANKKLIELFEEKIKTKIAEVWG